MSERADQMVENLPNQLDSFLSDFFPRKKWQSRVQYDHRARRFFLDVVLRDGGLADDERFLALIAFYGRGQRNVLREAASLELQFRLFSNDGDDLTPRLRNAESAYLEDDHRGSLMGRQIAWLGFRHRFARSFVPRSLLWAAAIAVLVLVFGLSFDIAVALCIVALLIQMVLTTITASRRF